MINRHLFAMGYHSRRLTRSPKMALVHRQWAIRHRVWDVRHWQHSIFTDESMFNLRHTDGRARVLRGQGERHIDVCVLGTDGDVYPFVVIWTGFQYGGKSELVVLVATMNQHVYRRVLPQSFFTLGKSRLPEQLVLLGISLENQDMKIMDWPSKISIWTPCIALQSPLWLGLLNWRCYQVSAPLSEYRTSSGLGQETDQLKIHVHFICEW